MNRETPEEIGIYLLSSSLPQHCLYTGLNSLQKLRDQLWFTACLQGSFKAVHELVDWTTDVNIGKPLIAKLSEKDRLRVISLGEGPLLTD
ncbi:hypothetical protein J4Q44_G00235280 [Coregonus suidteri]|uniref:MALT1 immunoglobulin-like domain-containing protein n=1 Tax=Coregonus suidteri TaxID=861788 RepID=A0AAN8QQ96_9TELE